MRREAGPVTLFGDGARCVLRRWVVFNLVGGTGFVVQLVVLTWLVISGLHYLAATAVAVEAAVLNNFFWHERWTWRDRVGAGSQGSLGRLARFNLTVGAVSITENLVLMKLLVDYFGLHYLIACVASSVMCGLANFLVTNRFVFRPSESAGLC